jgi:hypothetical protein
MFQRGRGKKEMSDIEEQRKKLYEQQAIARALYGNAIIGQPEQQMPMGSKANLRGDGWM